MSINNLSSFNSISFSQKAYSGSPQKRVAFASSSDSVNQHAPAKSNWSWLGINSLIEKYQRDSYNTFHASKATENKSGDKVTFGEGVKEIVKGVGGGALALVNFVSEHVVATAATFAAMYGVSKLAPFVGITSAAAGCAMTCLFEAMHIKSTADNTVAAIEHRNRKDYEKERIDLYKLGINALCLAIVTPFMPLALNQFKIMSKMNPIIGINKTLIAQMKDPKTSLWKKLVRVFEGRMAADTVDSTLLSERLTVANTFKIYEWAKPFLDAKESKNIAGQVKYMYAPGRVQLENKLKY